MHCKNWYEGWTVRDCLIFGRKDALRKRIEIRSAKEDADRQISGASEQDAYATISDSDV